MKRVRNYLGRIYLIDLLGSEYKKFLEKLNAPKTPSGKEGLDLERKAIAGN